MNKFIHGGTEQWKVGFYQLLVDAGAYVITNKVKGLLVELGTHKGASAAAIVDGATAAGATDRTFISIDPYGNIEYETRQDFITSHMRANHFYTNELRSSVIPELHEYIVEKGFNFMFLNLEDTEFMSRYSDGVPVYLPKKKIMSEYALVFIDGPHSIEAVQNETDFFVPRISPGGLIIYDDIRNYDHSAIEDHLLKSGFKLFQEAYFKKSYLKIK